MSSRLQLTYILLTISSFFKALGQLVVPKEKAIVCVALPLPGWFIIDSCMIRQVDSPNRKVVWFEWYTYDMPEEWVVEMNELKRRGR